MELSEHLGFSIEIAFATFAKRCQENRGNRDFDNSRLPAGSSMYYFCHGCFIQVAVMPESWWGDPPPKYCDACRVLADHGLLKDAREWVDSKQTKPLPPLPPFEQIKQIKS